MEPFNPYFVFHELYKNIDGYKIALGAQKKTGIYLQSFMYGEVTYKGLYEILHLVKPQAHETFYDLGSGTGKAVMIAALVTSCQKCVGIELLKDLYHTAETIKRNYFDTYLSTLPPYKKTQKIEFHHADFTKFDYTDADIVFMNSVAFHYEFDDAFVEKLGHLKRGTRIILTGTPIMLPHFTLIHQSKHLYSWGEESNNVYLKK
jgi:SAM-dependent methyltransferase